MPAVDIAFVGDSSDSNSLGRIYCLWLLAEAAGLSSITVTAAGHRVWGPLSDSPFASTVHSLDSPASRSLLATRPRAIVCVKPLPASIKLATSWSRSSASPLILDIDDPDIEAGLAYGAPVKRVAKSVLRPRQTAWFLRARRLARELPLIVSNPFLQDRYGGTLVPHIRTAFETFPPPTGEAPTIAFVGTNRSHKGVEVLRQAVASVHDIGYRITLTDEPPADAKPWENWVGQTSLERGIRLVGASDVVVIPSLDTGFSRGQLPAKLVDAMLLGRAVISTNLPAPAWALGDTGVLVQPGSADDIAAALRQLRPPQVRRALGSKAESRAEQLFTVEGNVASFLEVFESAMVDG